MQRVVQPTCQPGRRRTDAVLGRALGAAGLPVPRPRPAVGPLGPNAAGRAVQHTGRFRPVTGLATSRWWRAPLRSPSLSTSTTASPTSCGRSWRRRRAWSPPSRRSPAPPSASRRARYAGPIDVLEAGRRRPTRASRPAVPSLPTARQSLPSSSRGAALFEAAELLPQRGAWGSP